MLTVYRVDLRKQTVMLVTATYVCVTSFFLECVSTGDKGIQSVGGQGGQDIIM